MVRQGRATGSFGRVPPSLPSFTGLFQPERERERERWVTGRGGVATPAPSESAERATDPADANRKAFTRWTTHMPRGDVGVREASRR